MKASLFAATATSLAALTPVTSWLPIRPACATPRAFNLNPLSMSLPRTDTGASHLNRDTAFHQETFSGITDKIEQMLRRPELLSELKGQLYQQGCCLFSPGQTALFEFSNFYGQHRSEPTGYVVVPEEAEVCKAMVALANALHDGQPLTSCDIQINRWNGGVPPQPWHQDSPEDKMVWVLTGLGEPTHYLSPSVSDQYCRLDDANEISIATFECEVPDTLIQRGEIGKFLVFCGRQEEGAAQHALIHKGPGTLEAYHGRGTVRVVFK